MINKAIDALPVLWLRMRRAIACTAYDGYPSAFGMVFENAKSAKLIEDRVMAKYVYAYFEIYQRAIRKGATEGNAAKLATRYLINNMPESMRERFPYVIDWNLY